MDKHFRRVKMYSTVFDLPDQSILKRIVYTGKKFYIFDESWESIDNITNVVRDFYRSQIDQLITKNRSKDETFDLWELLQKLNRVSYVNQLINDIGVKCFHKESPFDKHREIPISKGKEVFQDGSIRKAFLEDYVLKSIQYGYNPKADSPRIESIFQDQRETILKFLNLTIRGISCTLNIINPGGSGATTLVSVIRNLLSQFSKLVYTDNVGHEPQLHININTYQESVITTTKEINPNALNIEFQTLIYKERDFFSKIGVSDYEYFLKIVLESMLLPEKYYVLMILYSDDYFTTEDPLVGRFFEIIKKLPMDIFQVLSYRLVGSTKTVIPNTKLEFILKQVQW